MGLPPPTPSLPPPRPRDAIAIGVLLVLFVVFHLQRIEADSPLGAGIVTFDSGALVDEGYKTYDARNRFLFGTVRWHEADEYGGSWSEGSPLNTALTFAVLRVAGLDLAALRGVTVLFAAATLLAFWLLLRSRLGTGAAWAGTLLLALHPGFHLFARLALLEVKLLFFAVAAVAAFPWKPARDLRTLVRLGVVLLACAAAWSSKETGLVFLASLGIGVAGFLLVTLRPDPRPLAAFCATAVAAGAIVALGLARACGEAGACALVHGRAVDPPLQGIRDFFVADAHFLNPALLGLALLGAAHALRTAARAGSGRAPEFVAVAWFLVPTVFFSLFVYQPERYFLLALPPAIWLALLAIRERRAILEWTLAPESTPVAPFALALAAFAVATTFTPVLLAPFEIDGEPGIYPVTLVSLPWGGVLAALCLGSAYTLRALGPLRTGARRILPTALPGVLLLGGLLGAVPIARWAVAPSHELRAATTALETLGEDAILAGDWAPQLGMLTRTRTVYSTWNPGMAHFQNVENLATLGTTHLLVAEGRQEDWLEAVAERFPGAVTPEPVLRIPYAGAMVAVHPFRAATGALP